MSLPNLFHRFRLLSICLCLLMGLLIFPAFPLQAEEEPTSMPDAPPPLLLCADSANREGVECSSPDQTLPGIAVEAAADAPAIRPATPVAFDCGTVSEIPQIECQALVAFYNSTNGPNWEEPTAWLNDYTPCDWKGITCDAGHVTRLDPNYLRCVNSPQCTILENFLMGSAGGTLPPELGNLSELKEFFLYDTPISGPIPPEIGKLSKLEYLQIAGTNLSSIPPELGNLSSLQGLMVQRSKLTGSIPPELGKLSNLGGLRLWGNQLSGPIPPELGQLSNLEVLLLNNNHLTGPIPPELGNLTKLEWLHLWGNQLTGTIPTQLGQLSQLTLLSLSQNQLSGSVPSALGNLSNLTDLNLTRNQLGGPIPVELAQLSQLETLALGGNQLSGPIPAQLAGLGKLEELYLWGNQLTGTIPLGLGQLSMLTDLQMSSNQLTGPIPTELGNLSNLRTLSLWDNQLSGSIPSQLGQLSQLTTLYLNQNQLSGSIPAQLSNLGTLTRLYLWENQLTGVIPSGLGQLSMLTDLQMSSNQLTGPIPTELGNLSNLRALSLWDNQLSGSIPSQLGQLSQLTTLYLSQNQLSGSIPAQLGNLSNLTQLGLSDNQLTGSIPPQLGNLSKLQSLSMWGNQLTGSIPAQLGQLSELTDLSLNDNLLSGAVPSELGTLQKLTFLELQTNNLSGTLPTSLTNLPLEFFVYDGTQLCEPADAPFQNWLAGIERFQGTHICPTGVAAALQISSDSHLVRADGVQTSTVTVQVVDVYSNPVALAGQMVNLTVPSGNLTATSLTTDGAGRAATTYRAGLVAGIHAIGAQAGPYSGSGEVTTVVTATQRAVDVALIIDSSGTMLDNDPDNLRISAAKVFLAAMQPDDYVTVVDFDHWFRIISRLHQIRQVRNQLLAGVERINSIGGTNLGLGLAAGYEQLTKAPFANAKAAVFLTDGDGKYNNEAQRYADAGWAIYTVSLGNEPKQALLDQIAAQTSGRSYHLDSAQQLTSIYLEIASRVTQAQMVLSNTRLLQPNETQTNNVTIPAGQTSAVFGTSWQGSTVDTKLTDPNGRVITPSTQDAKISYSSGPTYNLYQILDPIPGQWKVDIFGADLPDGAEDVTVQVLARSDTPVVVEDVEIFLPTVQR